MCQPKMRSLLVILLLLASLCALVARARPSSSYEYEEEAPDALPADPESLPPDTFRKLAQALYQRGDREENRLQRKFLYNENVTCNDGSVAGFYIRRNYQSKRWIIFLEGMMAHKNFG